MTFKALGLLVGMIIGAGMFALPYTVEQAGIGWSAFFFFVTAVLTTIMHLLYGAVLYKNHIRHRLPGYVREYLGEEWYWCVLVSRLFSYFGYLLAYGVLGGIFLEHFFPTISTSTLSIFFFVVLAPLLILRLNSLGTVNLLLTIPLVFFIVVLFFSVLPEIDLSSISIAPHSGSLWFLPYGIFLFAFSGASVIPEVVDLFARRRATMFRSVVISATLVTMATYALFIITILGITKGSVAIDGLSPLEAFGGKTLLLLGSAIGILAVATSYIALGEELIFTFLYDLRVHHAAAWAAVAVTPLVLYILGVNDFILILSIVGAVGISIEGHFIVALARRLLHTHRVITFALHILFLAGALLGLMYSLGWLGRSII